MKFKKLVSGITALIMAVTGSALILPGRQTLAQETDILYGDINEDGAVTVKDIVMLKKFLCENEDISDSQKIHADVNKDSELNIIDYVLIKNMLLEAGVPLSVIENAVAAPNMENYKRSDIKADTEDYNKFTANSAAILFADKSNLNPVYSPISVYMALSMLAECSDGTTLKELTDALCADDIEDLRKSNNDIFNNLYFDINEKNEYGEENIGYCKIANSIWLNDMYKYNNDTLKTLADSYYTSSFLKNFADAQTPKQISNWINKNTSGKFSPEIKIDDPVDEIIKIINTITFKDSWAEKFDESQKDIFHTTDNGDKECEFLNKTFEDSYIEYGDGFAKTSVAMNNGYIMNFVLPDDNTTVDQIVSSSQTMLDIVNDNAVSKRATVIFSVPEFNVKSKFDLKDWAKKLGINFAFDADNSDFSKITDLPDVFVSEITHEATILIDEEGCEAAAYTMIAMAGECFEEPAEEIVFKLDKPFYYYVSDLYGTPVFSGIINDPTSK